MVTILLRLQCVNSSPLAQNGRLFTDDIFRCIFVNEKLCILVKISPTFVPKGPIDNNLALVQIMAWCRIGDKPLSEPMQTWFTDAYTPCIRKTHALGGERTLPAGTHSLCGEQRTLPELNTRHVGQND